MEGKSDRLNFGHNDSQTHFAIESKFNLMGYRYGKATVFFDPESKSDFSVGDTQPSMGCHESLSSGVGVRGGGSTQVGTPHKMCQRKQEG